MASDEDMGKHCGKQKCGDCPIKGNCDTYKALFGEREAGNEV